MDPMNGAPMMGGAGQAAAPEVGGDLIKDSSTATFMADVIEASRQVPVLVDFWAPWCGPCKQLTPALERVVKQAAGKVRLVKINVDENQDIAAQMRVQSIPAVFAFQNGQPVDGFMGALPESQLKQFVEKLVGDMGPSPVEQLLAAAEEALAAGDVPTAMQAFSQVLQHDPENADAFAGAIRGYTELDDLEAAQQIAEQMPDAVRKKPVVEGALAALALKQDAAADPEAAGEVVQHRAALDADADNHQARYDLALALLATDAREDAVAELLELFRRDRDWNEAAARTKLVQLFEAWGPKDPLTGSTRRKLSSMMFS